MKRFYSIALSVLLADQLVKWLMLYEVGIAARPPIIITSFFRLVMVWNEGISFGMLQTGTAYMPFALIALALAICTWLFLLARKSGNCFEHSAYGLIVGGALGNVIDRIRFGAVADFFYFHIGDLGWPAFNIADAAICLGVAGLCLVMIRPK